MNTKEFFNLNLDHSIVIGYYGGTNYGDELLLEVVLKQLSEKKWTNIYFYYSNYKIYHKYHSDYKFTPINPRQYLRSLGALLKSKNIIIGGGGLWGMDFNSNIAILSVVLFVSRFLLLKKVYLVGVGAYGSLPKRNRLFLKIAALSASHIIARDKESYNNFSQHNANTSLSNDIAYLLKEMDDKNRDFIEKSPFPKISAGEKIVMISTRQFKEGFISTLDNAIKAYVKDSGEVKIILLLLTSRMTDLTHDAMFSELTEEFTNVIQYKSFDYNPLELYFYLEKYSKNICVISPQYHFQLISILTGTKFLPIRYDNKNEQLFIENSLCWINVNEVTESSIREFVNSFYNQ